MSHHAKPCFVALGARTTPAEVWLAFSDGTIYAYPLTSPVPAVEEIVNNPPHGTHFDYFERINWTSYRKETHWPVDGWDFIYTEPTS